MKNPMHCGMPMVQTATKDKYRCTKCGKTKDMD